MLDSTISHMTHNPSTSTPSSLSYPTIHNSEEFQDAVLLKFLGSICCPDTSSADCVVYPSLTNVPKQPWDWLAVGGGSSNCGGRYSDSSFRPVTLNLAPCYPTIRHQLGITFNYLMVAPLEDIESRCRGFLTHSQILALLARLPIERQIISHGPHSMSSSSGLSESPTTSHYSGDVWGEEGGGTSSGYATLQLVRELKLVFGINNNHITTAPTTTLPSSFSQMKKLASIVPTKPAEVSSRPQTIITAADGFTSADGGSSSSDTAHPPPPRHFVRSYDRTGVSLTLGGKVRSESSSVSTSLHTASSKEAVSAMTRQPKLPPSNGQLALTSMFTGMKNNQLSDEEHWGVHVDSQTELSDPFKSTAGVDFSFVQYVGPRIPPLDERMPIHLKHNTRGRGGGGGTSPPHRPTSATIAAAPPPPPSNLERPSSGSNNGRKSVTIMMKRTSSVSSNTSIPSAPTQANQRDVPVETANSLVRFWQRYLGISFKLLPNVPLMSVDSHALLAPPSSTSTTSDVNTTATTTGPPPPSAASADHLHQTWITYPAFNWLVFSIKCTPPEREQAMLWWENEALIIRRLREIERNKQGRGRVGSAAPTRTLTDIHGRKMLGVKHHRAGGDGLLPGKRGSAQYQAWLESTEIPLLALLVGLESTLCRTPATSTNSSDDIITTSPRASRTSISVGSAAVGNGTLKKHPSSSSITDKPPLSTSISASVILPVHFLRQGFKRFTSSSPWYHIQFEVAAQLHPGASSSAPHNTSTSSNKSSQSGADMCPRLLGGTTHLFMDTTTVAGNNTQVSPHSVSITPSPHTGSQLTSKELRLEALNGGFLATGLAVHTFNDYCEHLLSSPAATTAFLGLAMPLMVKRPIPPLRQKKSGTKTKKPSTTL